MQMTKLKRQRLLLLSVIAFLAALAFESELWAMVTMASIVFFAQKTEEEKLEDEILEINKEQAKAYKVEYARHMAKKEAEVLMKSTVSNTTYAPVNGRLIK